MDNNMNSNKEDSQKSKDEYTFVRETIKERPVFAVRVILKFLQVLGMGAVFGFGIWLVLFAFDKDIRELFVSGENTEALDGNGGSQETAAEEETKSEGDMINLEESINSKLANVYVVYYEEETGETATDEVSSEQQSTAIYEEENGTAAISDNKEVNKQRDSAESTVTESAAETETTLAEGQSSQKRRVAEKKHFTGLVISKKSDVYIWISYDKIKDGDSVSVSFGNGTPLEAEIYGVETINGMAMLRVKGSLIPESIMENISEAVVSDVEDISSGDKIIYAGNPYGMGRLFYTGALAGIDNGNSNYDTYYRGIITDINNSDIEDGFLFDESGRVIAMVSRLNGEQTAGKNVAGISMGDMLHIVQALRYKTAINHIGIKGEAVTDEMRELTEENMPDGMYVTDVARDSTAYKSGIMAGDIITSANGGSVESLKDVQSVLQNSSKNSDITIVLRRKIGTNYNEFTIKVPIESY